MARLAHLSLLQAIFEEIAKIAHRDSRGIEKGLKLAFDECKGATPQTSQTNQNQRGLLKVALVSFDDEKIAQLIAEAWHKLGTNGVLTVDRQEQWIHSGGDVRRHHHQSRIHQPM